MNKERMLELVQGQLEAYNQRDIEKFCTYFHPEVQVFRLNEVPIKTCEGMDSFKKMYSNRFANNPELHCELKSRIVLNASILDEEWVTGVVGQETPSHVVAIYSFRDNLIGYVYFTR